MTRYIILDLETTTKEQYGRKANPFFNEIVAIGLKTEGEEAKSFYTNKWNCNALNQYNTIVAHNAKFDLLYLWKEEHLQDYLRAGGKVWCTQLAHYFIHAFQEHYPALRDIAVRHYGVKEREKVMEPYWGQGVDTKDIPKELVLKDVENDVSDTEQIYLKQIQICQQRGILEVVELQMEALLCTLEMEYNGFKIDIEVLQKHKHELQSQLEIKQKELLEIVSQYWKEREVQHDRI
jgi:DNA polymerase I-like protein with 3'-5' exonuclease and polymerase domains